MALSGDLRERVVGAVVEGGMSRNAAAKCFGVSIASAVRWVARFKAKGEVSERRSRLPSRQCAERGELRIFELEIGGAAVASRIAFLLGSDLYVYYTGYDPAWKTYSVMTVLVTEIIKWAFAHGVERINLSTGRDQSKMRWKPREVLFRDAVQVSPTVRARAAFGAFLAYEALSRARVRVGARGRRLADQAADRGALFLARHNRRLPPMPHPPESMPTANCNTPVLVNQSELASKAVQDRTRPAVDRLRSFSGRGSQCGKRRERFRRNRSPRRCDGIHRRRPAADPGLSRRE